MYHAELCGAPYEAGLRFGTELAQKGVQLAENYLPCLTPERRAFSKACNEICARIWPSLLEEFHGIADGQQMDYEDLAAFIHGIYCFALDNHCTSFACRSGNQVLFGRNSDFLTALENTCANFYYQINGKYAFSGNTTALVQMEDGMNEHGFAVGLTFVCPTEIRPGLNAGLLLRYLLETCKTVPEALALLQTLPVSSSQTLTIADRFGGLAVVECTCTKMAVLEPPEGENFVVAVNRFQSPDLAKNWNADFDDWNAAERYRVAVSALKNPADYSVEFVQNLLSGKFGFLCQYDRAMGGDTVWSTVYDLTAQKIYRAEGNPSRTAYVEAEPLFPRRPRTEPHSEQI